MLYNIMEYLYHQFYTASKNPVLVTCVQKTDFDIQKKPT